LEIANCYAAQERAFTELILGYGLHHRIIGLKHSPVLRSSEWFPERRPSCAVSIWVECTNEASPIPLHNGYNGGIRREIASGSTSVGIIWTPNSVKLNGMGYTKPGGSHIGINNVVTIIQKNKIKAQITVGYTLTDNSMSGWGPRTLQYLC